VPIVGADNNGFIQQRIELQEAGLEGAIVSNPPPVGGVATAIAVDLLTEGAEHEQNTLLTPELHSNVDDLAALEELYLPELAEGESSTIEIDPYTTYTVEDVLGCRGPGE
jgi:ribose transport system substrate-binding protein